MPYKDRRSTAARASQRRKNYKQKYGVTIEQYEMLFNLQNGCCAICGQHQSKFKFRLAIDHNHQTTRVRGLLCRPCNSNIGIWFENPIRFAKVMEYLRRAQDGSE